MDNFCRGGDRNAAVLVAQREIEGTEVNLKGGALRTVRCGQHRGGGDEGAAAERSAVDNDRGLVRELRTHGLRAVHDAPRVTTTEKMSSTMSKTKNITEAKI